MTLVKRTLLILLVLAVPPVLTAALYALSTFMLHATHRVIDPNVLWYAAAVEFPVFFVFAVLDAKNRW